MDNIFNIITNLIVFVPIVVIFAILPFLTRKDIMFGVTIPSSEWKNEYFTKLRRQYMFISIASGTLMFAASILCTLLLSEAAAVVFMQVLMWAVLLVYFLLFLLFWIKTRKYKEQAGWQLSGKNIAVADTKIDLPKKALSPAWFIVYLVIIVVTYYGAVKLYGLAPDIIPMRFDLQGNPIVFAEKSMKIIYQLIGMQILMALMFLGINAVIKRAKKTIDPENPEKTSARYDMMKYRWSIFLFITGLLMLIIFAFVIFSIFVKMPMWTTAAVPFIIVIFILVYAIVLAVKTGQSGSRIGVTSKDTEGVGVTRDDDSLWKLGMFYYNKDDPAVFVEKRFGAGWTNNWARWQSWLVLAGIIAIVAVSAILGT